MKIELIKTKMNISNITTVGAIRNDSVEGTIVAMEEPRTFENARGSGGVCNATLEDATGSIKLTLWNNEIQDVEVGSLVRITDGWVSEYPKLSGNLQLTAGRSGKLEVIEPDIKEVKSE